MKWYEEGQRQISLGAPLDNNFNELEFWTQKYLEWKARTLKCRDLNYIIPWGRAMLANNMILLSFRYWAIVMHSPERIMTVIAEYVHALVWIKSCRFNKQQRRYQFANGEPPMGELAILQSARKRSGPLLASPESCVKALPAKTLVTVQRRHDRRMENCLGPMDMPIFRIVEQSFHRDPSGTYTPTP